MSVIESVTEFQQEISEIAITFDYTRGTTIASNQTAIWIEDANGTIVKMLYVSNFTATRRGYENRDILKPIAISNKK